MGFNNEKQSIKVRTESELTNSINNKTTCNWNIYIIPEDSNAMKDYPSQYLTTSSYFHVK